MTSQCEDHHSAPPWICLNFNLIDFVMSSIKGDEIGPWLDETLYSSKVHQRIYSGWSDGMASGVDEIRVAFLHIIF